VHETPFLPSIPSPALSIAAMKAHLPAALNLFDKVNHKNIIDQTHLKSKTQKQAFNLLQREDTHAKISRLESLLLHQFLTKYGVKTNSDINNCIKHTIHDFLSSFVNARDAEPHIHELESEIKQKTDSMKNAIKETKRQEKLRKDEEERIAMEVRQSSKPGSKGAPINGLNTISDSDWPIVNVALQAVTEERIKQEELKKQQAKKLQLKQALEEQLDMHKRREEEERMLKKKSLENVTNELYSYQREQEMQKQRREQQLALEKELRLQQIEERKRQREEEKQLKIAQERIEMSRALKQQEEEEEKKRLLKEKQKAAQDRLLLENEENKRIKEQQLRENQEYEKRLAREFE
jgi:hypothetical protein